MRARAYVVASAVMAMLALMAGPAQPSQAASTPAVASAGPPYVRTRVEIYGPDPEQRVTVMRLSTSTGSRPTAYFVHGGSWVMGTSARWNHEAKVWAERGWTVINVNYRLGVNGQLMLDDLRTVTQKYRTRYYVNPARQLLVGDSAGGQLATLMAARYPSEFRGVVAWSPVVSPQAAIATGAAPGASDEQVLLGKRAQDTWGSDLPASTALNFLTPQTPPLWVAASSNEFVTYADQGGALCVALGTRCTSTVEPGTEHGSRIATAYPLLEDEALAWAEYTVRPMRRI